MPFHAISCHFMIPILFFSDKLLQIAVRSRRPKSPSRLFNRRPSPLSYNLFPNLPNLPLLLLPPPPIQVPHPFPLKLPDNLPLPFLHHPFPLNRAPNRPNNLHPRASLLFRFHNRNKRQPKLILPIPHIPNNPNRTNPYPPHPRSDKMALRPMLYIIYRYNSILHRSPRLLNNLLHAQLVPPSFNVRV